MKPTTLKALKQSIAHWRRLATGKEKKGEHPDSSSCALCKLFIRIGCKGCPVAEKARETGCNGTPFLDAYKRYQQMGWGFASESTFRTAAKKELAFLESLLPKKPRK